MKAVKFLGLVLVIPFLAFALVSCSSTEKTEPPKPRASIDFEIENLPFSVYYSSWDDVWYCSPNIQCFSVDFGTPLAHGERSIIITESIGLQIRANPERGLPQSK